jgi:hypothetical protein
MPWICGDIIGFMEGDSRDRLEGGGGGMPARLGVDGCDVTLDFVTLFTLPLLLLLLLLLLPPAGAGVVGATKALEAAAGTGGGTTGATG